MSNFEGIKINLITVISASVIAFGFVVGKVMHDVSMSHRIGSVASDVTEIKDALKLITEVDRRVTKLEYQLLDKDIDTRVRDLEGKIVGKSDRGWHRDDMRLLWSEFQIDNPSLKFREIK